MTTPTTLLCAGAIQDAAGVCAHPGAVVVREGRIVAMGPVDRVTRDIDTRDAATVELYNHLILPGLVNAHAHLDLTNVGPRPFDGSFRDWLIDATSHRPGSPDEITAAVQRGLAMSHDSGTGYLADIAGSTHAVTARINAHLRAKQTGSTPAPAAVPQPVAGVSFIECFGSGDRQTACFERTREHLTAVSALDHTNPTTPIRIGVSPHAPYSCGLDMYRACADLADRHGLPVCTHLAESREELQFLKSADGLFAELLRHYHGPDETFTPQHAHPVDWLEPLFGKANWLLAHCNYVDDPHIETLSRQRNVSVVYCPVASEYFGHRGHRYRDMLDAGVNVCLGTDSILCQPPARNQQQDAYQPMGILAQMRRLFCRDATDPATLLAMATVNGMRALGVDACDATLAPGARANLIAVRFDHDDPRDPLEQVLNSDAPAKPLMNAAELNTMQTRRGTAHL